MFQTFSLNPESLTGLNGIGRHRAPSLNYLPVILQPCLTFMMRGAVIGSDVASLGVNVCVC